MILTHGEVQAGEAKSTTGTEAERNWMYNFTRPLVSDDLSGYVLQREIRLSLEYL
jgi:hypothetical protein